MGRRFFCAKIFVFNEVRCIQNSGGIQGSGRGVHGVCCSDFIEIGSKALCPAGDKSDAYVARMRLWTVNLLYQIFDVIYFKFPEAAGKLDERVGRCTKRESFCCKYLLRK